MTTDRIMSAIKIDKDLLTQMEIEEAMKIIKNFKWMEWKSCDNRPYKSIPCLIAYSDGEIVTGQYVHNSDFDRGGFFTSMKEFELNNIGEPAFWMPTPQLPKKKRSEAA